MKGFGVRSKYENDTLFIDTKTYNIDTQTYYWDEDRPYINAQKYVFKDSVMMDVRYFSNDDRYKHRW